MNVQEVKGRIIKASHDLAAFAKLERFIAGICIFIPALLVMTDGSVRPSISDYVSMRNAHIFGLLLTMAAMLFIVNGAIYIKTQNIRKCKKQGRWYNIRLGAALFGVVIFPHNIDSLSGLHYVFAIIFFLGNAVVIAFFNDKDYQKTSITISILTVMSFAVYFINRFVFVIPFTEWMTLFYAEWISLSVIGIHYILESKGKLATSE